MNSSTAEHTVAAGGLVPLGALAPGDRTTVLQARSYRHPASGDRVIVRLVGTEVGAAEDSAATFLGMVPDTPAVDVAIGARQELGFPEWILVHHPEDGHHALDLVPEIDHACRQLHAKPKTALHGLVAIGDRLAASLPHFLPTYYEEAGRIFLRAQNTAYAAQMFSRARTAEAEYALDVDEERFDAVFFEYASAGALPIKQLQGYATALLARVSAPEALRRFMRLCVRCVAEGLTPSPQMSAGIRKLAKAAGLDPKRVERDYLTQLLDYPTFLRASEGWWKAHRATLVALARESTEIRGALVNVMPAQHGALSAPSWLALLTDAHALDALMDPDLPATVQPRDGAAGWLRRFLEFRGRYDEAGKPMPELNTLVESIAGRLKDELDGDPLDIAYDMDLLDCVLALGIPVADPPPMRSLSPADWACGEVRRDLCALARDARFTEPVLRGLRELRRSERSDRAVRAMVDSTGGRPLVDRWIREVAGASRSSTLYGLPAALTQLDWIPAEVLSLAEAEIRAVASTDIAATLAATLRHGVLDELGWPAWDAAASELVRQSRDLQTADAWPYLIVAGPRQVRVLDADGPVVTHDLRISERTSGEPGFAYVDRDLLVEWSGTDGPALRGYWLSRPGDTLTLQGRRSQPRSTGMYWYRIDSGGHGLPLATGGRTSGHHIVHPGDAVAPMERPVIGDGHNLWVWDQPEAGEIGWREYDPVDNELGRRSLPGALNDALASAPPGATFHSGWLAPVFTDNADSASVCGVTGWCVATLPDGSLWATDLAGHTVRVTDPEDVPVALVTFPGSSQSCAIVRDAWSIRVLTGQGADVLASATTDQKPGPWAAGTAILPPTRYWHQLRARDPEGSRVLRAVDRDGAQRLLDVLTLDASARPAGVRAALPGVRNSALIAGLLGVAQFAARQRNTLDKVVRRLDQRLAEEPAPMGATATDGELRQALSGLSGQTHYSWSQPGDAEPATIQRVRLLGRLAAEPRAAASPSVIRPWADGTQLSETVAGWGFAGLIGDVAALALRAASPTTSAEDRAALAAILGELDAIGAGRPGAWHRLMITTAEDNLRDIGCGIDRDGVRRAFRTSAGVLAVDGFHQCDGRWHSMAVHSGPAGGPGIPAPLRIEAEHDVQTREPDGWLAEFVTMLAAQGPARWFPESAERFAELTGVTPTMARLIVAGLPGVDHYGRVFLDARQREVIGVKSAAAAVALDELKDISAQDRRAVVGALIPAHPVDLWREGPDVVSAAAEWNTRVGKRTAVPEAVLTAAARELRYLSEISETILALAAPDQALVLTGDIDWVLNGDRMEPAEDIDAGFCGEVLTDSVIALAWLAYRLPVGDPIRAQLPRALALIGDRISYPGFTVTLRRYTTLSTFQTVAGPPTEVGAGFERYGAVILATKDDLPQPAITVARLDSSGTDPYLAALRDDDGLLDVEWVLPLARSAALAALVAIPNSAGTDLAETESWWPHDPTRCVPDLVAQVERQYALGTDAATLYLMLLALPDPTDRNVMLWTGWKRARFTAAVAQLSGTDHVVAATRARAGRTLFLPGGWLDERAPRLPLEQWKTPLYELMFGSTLSEYRRGVLPIVPMEPIADLYRRAWQRVLDGDGPRFDALTIPRGARRR